MTLIESFDRSPLQNIAGCLALEPDLLILVGPEAEIEKSAARYRVLLQEKGMKTRVITEPLEAKTMADAVVVFETLVKKHSPCIFDLFGGSELLLSAAGVVYQTMKDAYAVALQQIDLQSGMPLDADGDGVVCKGKAPLLSVKESIELNGGLILSEKSAVAEGYSVTELDPLWSMMKKDPNRWNKSVGILNKFEKRANNGRTGEEFTLQLGGAAFDHEDRNRFEDLLEKLYLRGVLSYLNVQGDRVRYRYKNPLLHQCLKSAGNLLEYKTLLQARDYAPAGTPFFNDSMLGVMMDWDGVIHWNRTEADTKNEIDVIAMRGVVPLFISCKNGQVDEEELYKLNTVAATLGGEFAKKMLIATDYQEEHTASGRAFIQRAKDMNILLEPHAAQLDAVGWQKLFAQAFDKIS